jgi:hypothetical protein
MVYLYSIAVGVELRVGSVSNRLFDLQHCARNVSLQIRLFPFTIPGSLRKGQKRGRSQHHD